MRSFALVMILFWASLGAAEARAEEEKSTTLRAADAHVAAVAYRLAVGAVSQCPATYPATGMLLHHLPEYDRDARQFMMGRYGLDRGPGVLTVLSDSPAAQAGLSAGDVLLSINGAPFPEPMALGGAGDGRDWRQQVRATEAQVEAALRSGPASLTVLREGRELRITLASVPACPLRVRLARDTQLNAFAKDGYVILTTRMLEIARTDDELAFVIAHELAHNLLGHEDRLESEKVPKGLLRGFGKNAARVKATEIEADRLGLKLSWTAGFDPAAATAFWERFYRAAANGPQLFRTHPGLAARKRLVNEVIAELSPSGLNP